MIAEKRRLPMNAYRDNAFSTEGFFNWIKNWNVLKYTSAPLLIVKQYKCLYPKQEMLERCCVTVMR